MEDRDQRAEPAAQASSSGQQQAARLLLHLTDRNLLLPAITWAISPDGLLSGWTGHVTAPRDGAGEAFTAWRYALQLPGGREAPGRHCRPGSMYAWGDVGPVSVSLAARVLPPGPQAPGPDDDDPWAPGPKLTGHCRTAVAVLANLLDVHAGVPAITWKVSMAGELAGHAGAAASPRGAREMLAAWRDALGLALPARTPARLTASGHYIGQPVTITAGLPARPHVEAARGGSDPRPAPGGRAPRTTMLPEPRRGSTRPGPSQRP